MKILFVNNYESWRTVERGEKPSNHLFGVKEKIKQWNITDGNYSAILKDGLGDVHFVLYRSHRDFLKIFLMSWRYDIVYDTANVLKPISLLLYLFSPAKLVHIVHHPPFKKQFSYFAKADAYIFFSSKLLELAKEFAPKRHDSMFLNEWGPETQWYDKYVKIPEDEKKYDIVDNGRTARNHQILVKALEESGAYGFVFDDDLQGEDGVYESPANYVSEDEAMFILCNSKYAAVLLSPLDRPYGPIGATVLVDALGLGLPVVVSSNFYYALEVEDNNLGIVVPFDKHDALVRVLSDIHNGNYDIEVFQNSISEYCNSHNMDVYSEKLFTIFRSLVAY